MFIVHCSVFTQTILIITSYMQIFVHHLAVNMKKVKKKTKKSQKRFHGFWLGLL